MTIEEASVEFAKLIDEPPKPPPAPFPLDPEGVRFHRLKQIRISPAHYLANVGGESEPKTKGTAVHSVLLQGKRVTFYPEKTSAGKAAPRNGGKWEAFRDANPDAQIVTSTQYEQIMRMVDAVRANRHAMEVLDGAAEQTLRFKFLGLDCRTTPDVHRAGQFVTELKTTASADPNRFGWQSFKFCYHGQMAYHRIGIKASKFPPPPKSYVVAVESRAPYPVTVFTMLDRAIEKGDKTIRFWFEQLKGCLASNQWPEYAQSIVDLDVPEDEELFSGGADDGEQHSAENLPAGW